MTDSLDLPDRYRRQVEALLAEHVPEAEVWAYGSRVNGRSHDASDLDLVLRGPNLERIPTDQLADLEEALEQSNIPILIQTHDWARLPASFHEEIAQRYVSLQHASAQPIGSSSPRRQVSIGDCATLVRDLVDPRSVDSDLPYIGLEHIGKGTLKLLGQRQASEATSLKSRYMCGDILFGRLRPYFRKLALAPSDGICSTDIWVIRTSEDVDQEFLFYCMSSPQFIHHVSAAAEGTRMPRANWNHACDYRISLPEIEEQHLISHILGTIDGRIKIGESIIKTLETIAQALFKSCFIDFDPVQAQQRGTTSPLLEELAHLFPRDFADSELGPIPSGWHIGTLGDIAQEVREAIQPKDIEPQAAYIALEHMPRNRISLSEWSAADDIASGKLVFRSGQILFGRLRPYFHKVGVAPVDGVCSTDIIVVSPMSPAWFGLVLGHMSSARLVDYASAVTTGTRMPRVNWTAISSYNIAIPPLEFAEAYTELVRPYVDQIVSNTHEALYLSKIRDAALPHLLSDIRTGTSQ